MGDEYTKDIASILNSFLADVQDGEGISDLILRQLEEMVSKGNMRDTRSIDQILSILWAEADELQD